jgi:hypothetical protein
MLGDVCNQRALKFRLANELEHEDAWQEGRRQMPALKQSFPNNEKMKDQFKIRGPYSISCGDENI